MKRVILLLILCSLCLSTAIFAEEKYDFRKTRWGMSIKEVKASEKINLIAQHKDSLVYGPEIICNKNCNAVYFFVDNKLYQGIYDFYETHTNTREYLYDFKDIVELLQKKYGEAQLRQHGENNYDDKMVAIAMGELSYIARWELDDTEISLLLSGGNLEIHLTLFYESKQLRGLADENEKNESIEKL